ncbi:MAG: BatD family protein [Muribaculaceae bacterium]|nr:BatD family protein [Muribaculaceae bacterium]
MKQLHNILAGALMLAAPAIAGAQQLSVKATADSMQLIMGSKADLHIEVIKPAGPGALADAPAVGRQFGGVDIVDFRLDSTDLGNGRTQLDYTYTYQAFDPGPQTLPALTYHIPGDSAKTEPLVLKVFAVSVDSLATTNPDVPVMTVQRKLVDYIPDAIADYWWIWLLGLILAGGIALVWWLIVKKGKLKRVAAVFRKPPEAPFDKAIRRLNEIREQRLAQSGNDKHYFTELTDVLRTYLNGRFGIYAMEMTSKQIVEAMNANSETARFTDSISPVLELADIVKFAKMRTSVEENQSAYAEVRKLVELTKPVEEEAPTRQQRRRDKRKKQKQD